jgi:ubiquinone/menaquinone biosynthesis C-methylase UbiE
MHRILEPELMDTPAEALAYDAMDHAEVNRLFVEDLLQTLRSVDSFQARLAPSDAPPLEVLDLGAGTAQIPIELCRRSQDLRVVAIDAATSMLEVAIRNIDIAGLRDRIMLARVDAKSLPYHEGRFAILMSNSIVHHIPEPVSVLREAVRVAAPSGILFFRDLLRPVDDAGVEHLVQAYAGGADEQQQKMFADSLRAALTLAEIRSLVAQLGFPADSVQQTSDRHWTWSAVKRP